MNLGFRPLEASIGCFDIENSFGYVNANSADLPKADIQLENARIIVHDS